MSCENWLEAARKYAAKPPAQKPRPEPSPANAVATAKKPGTSVAEIAEALLQFRNSNEGIAALELLRASKRHIVIVEKNEGGGYGCVFFLDGDHYKSSVEAMGTWQVCSKEVKDPKVQAAGVKEIAETIVRVSGGKATVDEVVEKLRKGLDAIAAQADK